ncbi:MAG: ribonuclease III [Spirochaeta sp. LUC14_002_19_P3]|nr:MAG: ribonuclease III [Spirochaeta sp. LUC14_002_19_P3]
MKTPKVSGIRKKELIQFQKKAALKFKHLDLLELALCHRSYVNEIQQEIDNNERLEFLGDAVLGAVIADYLFRLLPDRAEGDLAKVKSHVVSEDSLAEIATLLGIDRVVRVGRGEEISGGRQKKALLSDSMEALIGAWYLDAGYDKTEKFILSHFKKSVAMVLADKHEKDYKTLLQEAVQKKFHSYPQYVLEKKTGPDHKRKFWFKVIVNGVEYGPGVGSNKKTAEKEAARLAWESITDEESVQD